MTKVNSFIKKNHKEAYIIPIILSLFLVPLFWNPSFIYTFTQGKELFFKAVIICTLLGMASTFFYRKKISFKKITNSPLFLLLILQISIFAVTNIFSSTPTIALYGTYSRGFGFIIELFLFVFLIYCALTLSEKVISKLLKIAFASALVISIHSILQKFGIDPFFSHYSTNIFAGRVFSFLGNPSYLGQFMLLQTIIGGYLTLTAQKKYFKYLYFLGTVLFITTLFLSGTRTALLGLAITIFLITIRYAKCIFNLIKIHKKVTLLGVLIISLIFALLPKDRYSFSDISMRSLNSRIEIWDGTLDLIKKRPILGYGGESFYVYFPEIITKEFLTLEENINISADRIHNETLEVFFSHGFFALLIYLAILGYMFKIFFKSKNKTEIVLSLLIIANIIQNQFAFPDISISVLIAFCFGGILSLNKKDQITITFKTWQRILLGIVMVSICLFIGFMTVFKPWMSQISYSKSKENYSIDYVVAVNKHKEALYYTPYYSELWYELMFIDRSSMERSLHYLEQIEGDSGNVLAWKGNFYSKTDPDKASEFYTMALEKNPYHPNWIRAFADMLYKQEDYENALFLYNKYLKSIPDFWEWKDELEDHSAREQNSYESFLKQTPYFWGVIEKINDIVSILEKQKI